MMRITLHDSSKSHLLALCESLELTPSQVVKLLSTSYDKHINKGQPLELQGVIYEPKEKQRS